MSFQFHRILMQVVSPLVFIGALGASAQAQEVLPEIVVQAQRPAPPRPTAAPSPQLDSNATLAAQNTKFDVERDNLSPRFGASTFDMN